MFKKILKVLAAVLGLLIVAGISVTVWFVIYSPGDKIRQEAIEKILGMESPVFYNDGISKIGVFFKEAHRQYIYYRDIPTDFSNALVAAEDNSFFSHHGVDFTGILRAMQANIRAGKIVQGGSTITQQTAKNLFKRKDRSYTSKLKELLFAFQLEYHYTKEKILEFYANQFYVSGNGHGLGVAARYYFDKPASELDLLECAFIAGSVKRPNYYNPFTKDSEEEVQLAKARAKQRTAYVLKQMYRLGMISMEQYETQLARDIDFKKGKMKYPLNSIMDTVKAALNAPAIEEALAQHGIDNVATSGIRIFTTIDRGLQERALADVRKELSRLDVRLRGYSGKELQNRYRDLEDAEGQSLSKGSFLFGRITDIDAATDPIVSVTLGEQSATGRIDKQGLMPLLDSLVKWQNQRWTEADDSDLPLLLKQLRVQDLVYVSIRGSDEKTGEYLLDLEKYPELQGALLAKQKGVIRAMVGGMENHFFNRAIAAKRPMGSIMKPLVFAAALQLGWNSIDPLKNQRDIFIFHDQPYFPRPDHFSPYDHVSISWAGVHSENVATVWLLYHLCDHLNPGQFKDLVANVGLARRQDESYQQYSRRIRDEHGIIVDQESLYRAAFRTAVKEIEADLIFAGRLKEYEFLKTLHYGTGFEDFAEEVDLLDGPEYESEARQKELVTKEIEIRKNILARSFLNFTRLREELRSLRNHPQLYGSEEMIGRLYYNRLTAAYIYSAKEMTDDQWQPLTADDLSMVAGQFPASAASEQASTFFNSVLIEGMLSSETLDLLKTAVEKKYKYFAGLSPYSPEVLHDLQDFRVTAGLYYLTDLGHALGITSQLDPVLSFPLGSNVISPLETARLYETLVTGEKISYGPDGEDQPAIIDRIENSDGEAVYRTTAETRRLFSPKTTVAVSDILQNVIRFGTGRQARNDVRLQSTNPETRRQLDQLNLHVPLLGKTGTANRFTNSAFAGYIPEVATARNHLILDNGYTVAVYVGFDDNAPMVRTSTHITGSSGALPLWIRFVNSLLYEKEYDARLDLIDITFNATLVSDNPTIPLTFPPLGQVEMEVGRENGLLLPHSYDSGRSGYSANHPTVITFGSTNEEGEFEPSRFFVPYWQKISDDF